MIKVFIVDDEELIREGLCNLIDWHEIGFEVVGKAEDGELALELVDLLAPDVIITDIKMPFINGLELIERVKAKNDNIIFVILSGYDEFQFAQKAIELSAHSYLLKPVEPDILISTLLKVKSVFDSRVKNRAETMMLRHKVEESELVAKEKLIKRAVFGLIGREEIEAELNKYNINPEIFCVAVIVEIDDYYVVAKDENLQKKKIIMDSFKNIVLINKFDPGSILVFENNSYSITLVLWNENERLLKKRISEVVYQIRVRANNQSVVNITIAVGDITPTMYELSDSYEKAYEALSYKFVLGKNQDIYYKDINDWDESEIQDIVFDENAIINLIKFNDKEAIEEKMGSLVSYIKSKGCDSSLYLQVIINSIYTHALKLINEIDGAEYMTLRNSLETYKRIMSFETAEDKIDELKKMLIDASDYLNKLRNNKYNRIIEKVKEYIENNYVNKDCSLEEAANYVNVSLSYLSLIFKQETGQKFIDYLTSLRIGKAKDLLRYSTYRSSEISYMIGYENPTYFSSLFKKHIGLSPTEYRKSISGEK